MTPSRRCRQWRREITSCNCCRISRNLGFGAGANQGARAAGGEVLLILNPDAVAEAGAVAALLQCLESTGAAAAGGALLEEDGQPQRGFAFRRLPTLTSLLCEVLLINQLWPGNPVNRRYRCLDADYSRQQEVEQPAGACLAITRTAWEALGGFDPQFFPVWFEDVDLCKRLHDMGQKIVYCPAARFRHSGAHSVGKLSLWRQAVVLVRQHDALCAKAFLRRTSVPAAAGDHQGHAAAIDWSVVRRQESTAGRKTRGLWGRCGRGPIT